MFYFLKNTIKLFIFNNNFDTKIKKLMLTGFKFSFILTLFSILLLSIYITYNPIIILFKLGFNLFNTSTIFMVTFLINGIVFNKLKQN